MNENPTVSGREIVSYFAIAGVLAFALALGVNLLGGGELRWREIVGFAIVVAILLGGLTVADVSERRDKKAVNK